MIIVLTMLRLIITLAVCMTLARCASPPGSGDNQVEEGPDKGPQEEAEDQTSCYVCNSHEVDGCEEKDYVDGKNATLEAGLKHINCAAHFATYNASVQVIPPPGSKYFCTKTIINFEFPDTVEDKRIIRACSFAPGRYGWAGCYYTATPLYSTTVCKCTGDGCNSATSIASSLFVFVTGLLMLR